MSAEKPTGYWKEKSNIVKEAKDIILRYGHLPASSQLQSDGYSSFNNAVCRYYGGFHKLRNDLGQKQLQTQAGAWSKSRIKNEFQIIIDDHGHLPSRNYLKSKGYSALVAAAERHYGGLRNIALKCGVDGDDLKKPDGYWRDWNNIRHELGLIIDETGEFPSDQALIVFGKGALRTAIQNYHGGLIQTRKNMGFAPSYPIAEDGDYCDSFSEKIVDDFLHLNSISHIRNRSLQLGDVKCVPDFFIPPNGIIEVLMVDYRTEALSRVKQRYVHRYEKKRNAYISYKYNLLEVFPEDFYSQNAFRVKCKQLLQYFSENTQPSEMILTLPKNRRSPGYWRSLGNIKAELRPICDKLGRFPTYGELETTGRSDLIHAINRYHNGPRKLARKIGCLVDETVSHKPRGFWKDNIEHVISELGVIHESLGQFPTSNFLRDEYPSLYYAIVKYYGGIKSVRKVYIKTVASNKMPQAT
jgi:hypothetical protein